MGVKYRLCWDYHADKEKMMGIGRIVDQDCEVDDEKKMGAGWIVDYDCNKKKRKKISPP